MRRFLWLWLTLLGAFWAARALISVLLERFSSDTAAFLALAAVPTLQAVVLWWATRARPSNGRQKPAPPAAP
jgi:hypothetical protein